MDRLDLSLDQLGKLDRQTKHRQATSTVVPTSKSSQGRAKTSRSNSKPRVTPRSLPPQTASRIKPRATGVMVVPAATGPRHVRTRQPKAAPYTKERPNDLTRSGSTSVQKRVFTLVNDMAIQGGGRKKGGSNSSKGKDKKSSSSPTFTFSPSSSSSSSSSPIFTINNNHYEGSSDQSTRQTRSGSDVYPIMSVDATHHTQSSSHHSSQWNHQLYQGPTIVREATVLAKNWEEVQETTRHPPLATTPVTPASRPVLTTTTSPLRPTHSTQARPIASPSLPQGPSNRRLSVGQHPSTSSPALAAPSQAQRTQMSSTPIPAQQRPAQASSPSMGRPPISSSSSSSSSDPIQIVGEAGPVTVRIDNLHPQATEDDMMLVLGKFGPLIKGCLYYRRDGDPTGSGEAVYRHRKDAENAVNSLNGSLADGYRIHLEMVSSRPSAHPLTPTPISAAAHRSSVSQTSAKESSGNGAFGSAILPILPNPLSIIISPSTIITPPTPQDPIGRPEFP
ncbi:MAG: hypothetical protein DHS80DRAFT_23847 [Piptocephalis tieghemiana]|nr:MAG: hypothetical protein DHS80DRAFT_23847 [Piptocephalis tieghemiana]